MNERFRKVTTFPVTTDELVTLSALNPIAAALLGWGISAAPVPGGPVFLGIPINAMVLFGGLLQLIAWGQIYRMWRQTGS